MPVPALPTQGIGPPGAPRVRPPREHSPVSEPAVLVAAKGRPRVAPCPSRARSAAAGVGRSRAGCHDRRRARGRRCVALRFQSAAGFGQRRGRVLREVTPGGSGEGSEGLGKQPGSLPRALRQLQKVPAPTRTPRPSQSGSPRAGGRAGALLSWFGSCPPPPRVTTDFSVSARACRPPASLLR